ncbi:MAG: hypothetical protein JNL97_03770, partial [Verrucomicrobiales bacterium]|nr:hypothetical protein [Verrucomicrobiales bacterium]
MIGVLAILTVTASVLSPGVAARISRQKGERDQGEIDAIGAAVIRSITSRQEIPGSKSWSARAAAVLGVSENEVLYAIPGEATTLRVYLIHPSFTPSGTYGPSSSDPLWTEGATGATSVSDARIMILSVHRPGLALPFGSGTASSTNAFEAVWTWNYDATTGAPPSGWPASWDKNGRYLHVRRLHVGAHFRKVTFSNVMYGTAVPYVRINDGSAGRFASSATYDAFYLEGTTVRLYRANSGSETPGDLQIQHVLRDWANFVYANQQWAV